MGALIPTADSCCSTDPATGSYQLEGCAAGVPFVQITHITASAVTVTWVNLDTGDVETTKPVGFAAGSCGDLAPVAGVSDEFVATAGQTAFTLTGTPLGEVWAFRNGARIPKASVTVAGTTATYVPAANGGFTLIAGERINIDYVKAV
jgi:hypothetical protein